MNEKIEEIIKELENGVKLATDRVAKGRINTAIGYLVVSIDNALILLKKLK